MGEVAPTSGSGRHKNMRPVPAGHFVMGSDRHYPEERPAHEDDVAAFWIDEHPVTNAEFRRFVLDSGYRTTAESAPPGKDRTTAIGTYPPNSWGLVDMIGNVWDWTSTPWADNHETQTAHHESCCAPHTAREVGALGESDRRVMKGGSHLCAPS
ncbi:MAG TPA: SUMF1/EgtB/PvdO family nonheme iron enzyme [Jatrophihabitantaceae bacterium]